MSLFAISNQSTVLDGSIFVLPADEINEPVERSGNTSWWREAAGVARRSAARMVSGVPTDVPRMQ